MYDLGILEKSSVVCYGDAGFEILKIEDLKELSSYFFVGTVSMEIKDTKQVIKSTLPAETLALEDSLETCFMVKYI